MKMIKAGTSGINDFSGYVYNCTYDKCKRPYLVPLPSFDDLQLYVNFGTKKPTEVVFTAINRCTYGQSSVINSECFLMAHNGSYWYGVFNKFTPLLAYEAFLIALEVTYDDSTTGTFFSEVYSQGPDCRELTKLQVCYPVNYNSEDINDIYVGEPDLDYAVSGKTDLIYQHKYWVRDGEVVELQNKLTFVSNSKRNFHTTVNKIYEFRSELVPGWYKDYMLAVYFRGNFTINGVETKASEFSGENIEEGADLWKPNVKIDKELKGAFGCAPVACVDECVCIPPSLPAFTLEPLTGVPFSKTVAIVGSPAFALVVASKPFWMNIYVDGSNLIINGTPDTLETPLTFTLSNQCGVIEVEKAITYTCNPPAYVGSTGLPGGLPGVPYNHVINLTGTPVFTLTGVIKPAWLTITVVDSSIVFSGTPDEAGDVEVSFTVENCSETTLDFEETIEVYACGQFVITFTPPFPTETANYEFMNCTGEMITGSLNNGTVNECMAMNEFNEPIYFTTDSGYLTNEYIGPC